MKKVFVLSTTEGCATNLIENATYRQIVGRSGHENVYSLEEADTVVINTCSYTTSQEVKSIDLIKKIQSTYQEKEVIVGGCLINTKTHEDFIFKKSFSPGNAEEFAKSIGVKIEKNYEGSNFFDANDFPRLSNLHKFFLYVRPWFFYFEKMIGYYLQPLHNVLSTAIVNDSFYGVTVSQGCAGHCTFCSIKMAKGHVKSKSIAQVRHEIEKGLEKGQKKIWLLGDDIGCYGVDLNTSISELLKSILEIPLRFDLVINYFEPHFLVKHEQELIELFKDKRILNVNFPIQSGSNKIIERMGREYRIEIVQSSLKKIRKVNKQIVLKTNIIVGFPGECWSDFWCSLKAVFYFDAIFSIKFANRQGTRANNFENQVGAVEKNIRFALINLAIWLRHGYVAFKSLFLWQKIEVKPNE